MKSRSTSRAARYAFWQTTVSYTHLEVELDFMFVDNAAMQIIRQPTHFDVIVTENMFGDILTDEASVISGSLGMLPSASVGSEVALLSLIHISSRSRSPFPHRPRCAKYRQAPTAR